MKKIIIFGATGNVGSYLSLYANSFFEKNEFQIIASGRRETDIFVGMGIEYVSVDITKEEEFSRLPTENVYAIMLLSAQIPSYMENYESKKYIDSIILGGYNVLEYARKVKADRILYTQTVFDVSLYPHDHVLHPYDKPNFSYKGDHAIYVIAKNTMLELINHYHEEYGLRKFIFRLPTIYGYSPYPYYFPNGIKTMRPVYQMIKKAIKGETIEIWGDGSYAKDMVHVYDFSQMLCKAVLVNRDSGFYNVGTGVPVTIEEQVRTIIEVFSSRDTRSEVVLKPTKECTGGFLMDITNAREELGYVPQYSCKDIFEDFKKEMVINRFARLRLNNG